MTDLPASTEFSSILVIVDQFSKGCHLIPLKGLPTAMETTELLFIHVFWNFLRLPKDIDSDRGPSPEYGKPSSHALVWPSASRHPQTNGHTERKIQEVEFIL